MTIRTNVIRFLVVLMIVGFLIPNAEAVVYIKKKDGSVIQGDNIKASSRGLLLQKGSQTLTIKFADIDQVRSPAPPQLNALLSLVGKGKYAAATAGLRKVVTDYARQEHDLKAGAALIRCYVATGEGNAAVNIYKNLTRLYGAERIDVSTRIQYWDALISLKKYSTLQPEVDAVMNGNADIITKGAAAVKMGDVLAAQGKYDEALTDGYLKAIYMYGQARSVQPKAYEGAYTMLKNLRDKRAEKMRKELVAKFPTSKEARTLK